MSNESLNDKIEHAQSTKKFQGVLMHQALEYAVHGFTSDLEKQRKCIPVDIIKQKTCFLATSAIKKLSTNKQIPLKF